MYRRGARHGTYKHTRHVLGALEHRTCRRRWPRNNSYAGPDTPGSYAEGYLDTGEAKRESTAAGTARRTRTAKVMDAEEVVERERATYLMESSSMRTAPSRSA